jgi:hypothetical protein
LPWWLLWPVSEKHYPNLACIERDLCNNGMSFKDIEMKKKMLHENWTGATVLGLL